MPPDRICIQLFFSVYQCQEKHKRAFHSFKNLTFNSRRFNFFCPKVGYMKKSFYIAVIIFLFVPLYNFALNTVRESNTLLIQGDFDNCEISNEKRGELQFCSITISDYSSTANPGKALMPLYSQLISLPSKGNYVIESIIYDYDEKAVDMPILHCGWEDGIEKDIDFYKRDEWYPKEIVTIGSPIIMRGYRFCQITLAPVQYNPAKNKIRVLKDIDAKFSLDASIVDNPLKDTKSRPSSSFSKIVSEHVYGAQKEGINENGSYLIITPDDCVSTLQSLVQWKRKLGHEVTLTPLSEIGASPDNYEIKNYIQNAYLSWDVPPEFVILVGDVTGNYILPSFYVQGTYTQYDVSDHEYSLLDGDDYFSDVLVGRISIQNLMELMTIVAKLIHYESLFTQGEWYNDALMISSYDDNWGIYTQYITKMNVKEKLLNFGFEVDAFTYPYNSGVQQLINWINNGYSFINYRGFGYHSGWDTIGYTFFVSDDIVSLNNYFMLPMVTSITCGGGDFASSAVQQCFGEVWLKEGTPMNPKGAIGFIGPSERDTQIEWNNCMDMGIYQGIVYENINRCGEMLLRGKMELYNNYPHNHAWGDATNSDQFYFYVYNLLGDPGLQVWTDNPKNITLITESTISEQQNYIEAEVDVEDDMSNFMIALTIGDSLVSKAFTDENGEVTFYADFYPGNYQITASKYGYLPETNDLTVYSDELLELTDVTYSNDPISGNTIEYELTFYNPASITAENIMIYFSSDDETITIISDSISITSITPYTSHICDSLYLEIDEKWQNGKTANLNINLSSNFGEQSFSAPVAIISPELVLSNFIVQNNECYLVQDQEDNVFIELTNTGSIQSELFYASLFCTNEKATITQDESYYTSISINGTGANAIPFTVIPDEVISGEIAQFEMQIIQYDSLVQRLQFSIPIGIISETSPTFSNYGYYAIESSDTGFFNAPVYDWIELDPSLGGEGMLIEGSYVTEDGYVKTIDLPFSLVYFGHYYYEVTICSEGWLSMGEELIYHRNRTIPSGCGPAAMIAPFWDDLKDGELYKWYDEIGHRFIVEWQEFSNVYDPAVKETFQVILYDPEYFPTSHGNVEILFQYKTISNIDQNDNYATVGIENYAQTDGVLLSYSNIYAPTAHILQNETAILFTLHESPEVPFLEAYPSSFNYTLPQDTTISDCILLVNTSSTDLSYSIKTSHYSGKGSGNGGKNIENDFIISSSSYYFTSMPMDIFCYLYHTSSDDEAVYGVNMDFPNGVYVNNAMDINSLSYNGETGNAAEVTWGFGNGDPLYTLGIHSFGVNVTVEDSITGPITIDWYIEGDGTGTAPHTTQGTITLQPSTTPYLWLMYPNGGETLVYSTTDTIRWTTYGTIENVNLYITLDNCSTWETIAEDINNTGEYSYTVTWSLSDMCKINVRDADGYTSDNSDNLFSINIFDIIHPEDGDVIAYNTLDTLRWNYTGIYDEVILELSRDNGCNWEVINDTIPNTGEFEYLVPGPPSDWCVFRITAPDFSISNCTKGNFKIIDPSVNCLSLSSNSGTLSGGESTNITFNVTTQGMEPGYYEAYICIKSGIGQKINIPVTIEVSYAIDDEPEPNKLLIQNIPNPFSTSTTINFNLTTRLHSATPWQAESTEIKIYNVKGQLVRKFLIVSPSPSLHVSVTWDGRDEQGNKVSSGLYFYQVKVGVEIIGTNKCLLMKD